MSQRKPDTRRRPEPTPFKSKAQKKYKSQRRKNDIYSTVSGHKNLSSGAPYNNKTQRAGTDRLRFEVLEVDPEGFQINDELEPRIWKDEKLRGFVSKKLMEIANDFVDGLPFNVVVQDVRFTGSLANYHWSRYSDIDLHIVVDFEEIDDNKELVKEMFDAKRLRWNEHHDMVNKPERTDTTIDLETAKKKASDIEQQVASISAMYDRGQFEKVQRHVDRLKKKIRTMRQAGLDTEAMEFSPENIAFKLLRRNNLLDMLTKLKYKAYDQSMTLDD
jgi:hypothetical protein